MRTIRIKAFKFNELSKDAKVNAINWFLSTSVIDGEFAWEHIKDDAKEIGLKIHSLDDHRPNYGEFIISAPETANLIMLNHGKDCDTYKDAKTFLNALESLTGSEEDIEDVDESEIEELEDEFLKDLLEDYRIMFNKDIEYQSSEEYIVESMEANEYEFTKDGKHI